MWEVTQWQVKSIKKSPVIRKVARGMTMKIARKRVCVRMTRLFELITACRVGDKSLTTAK